MHRVTLNELSIKLPYKIILNYQVEAEVVQIKQTTPHTEANQDYNYVQ